MSKELIAEKIERLTQKLINEYVGNNQQCGRTVNHDEMAGLWPHQSVSGKRSYIRKRL